jgi:hypothetical protein
MNAALYPPGPKRCWLPGNHLLAFRRAPLDFLMNLARRYGDIAHAQAGQRHLYLLSHPDFIQAVLVNDQHCFVTGPTLPALWKRLPPFPGEDLLAGDGDLHQRRLIQPAFHALGRCWRWMIRTGCRTAAGWSDGQALDLRDGRLVRSRRRWLKVVALRLAAWIILPCASPHADPLKAPKPSLAREGRAPDGTMRSPAL